MRQKKLLWRIYLYFFAATLAALTITTWYVARSLYKFHQDQAVEELLVRARIIAGDIAALPPGAGSDVIDRLCKKLGSISNTRFTVVASDGAVLGDSEENPAGMENHSNRREIVTALHGEIGKEKRISTTRHKSMLYLALPVNYGGDIVVVRTALPLTVVDWALHALYRQILIGAALVAVFFALVAFSLSRRIIRPLDEMRHAAERLARDNLSDRIALPDTEEIGTFAKVLNGMADKLSERMATITRQRNEQAAVFASMTEGVLAVDNDERILFLNHAAARLLEIDIEKAHGRSILEAVRNRDLQDFIGATLRRETPTEKEVVLYGAAERHLQLNGSVLCDAAHANIGAVIVLNDISRIIRLETVRRDFVANVSHELKTPITALKGCVDTMTGPSPVDPGEARHFMDIIARQVNRLQALVEDLLSLSRIEHETEHGLIVLEPGSIANVIRRAIASFTDAAATRHITLDAACPDDLVAPINPSLLEQAIGDLLDNAIKYSGENTRVTVNGTVADDVVEIRVIDQGPGIEKKHCARIFERFYRVDQARSRSLGGTGLGLSIVKHIALAHRGDVDVVSTPGQGSTFTIRIPVS